MHKYVVSHIETQCLKGFCQELSKCGVAVQRDGGAKKEMKHAFVRRQGFLYWLLNGVPYYTSMYFTISMFTVQ